MRSEMIYGPAPEFDDLLQQLRGMNTRFVAMGHQISIDNVIVKGYEQIEAQKAEWDFQSTIVHYNSDLHRPIGPDNMNISFEVEYVKENDDLIFHRLRIRQF